MSRVVLPEEIESKFPVPPLTLLNERGGAWLGVVHSFIQRKAMNGEQVIWGSNDLLHLRDQTVLDLETLAATIAAAAMSEVRLDYEDFFQDNKPSGMFARKLHGDKPTVITKIWRTPDGELDHDHCTGAHSWMEGGITFGQGEFRSYGAWNHPCEKCSAQYKASIHEDNQVV